MSSNQELPMYSCHKKVRAAKIQSIHIGKDGVFLNFEKLPYNIPVDQDWMTKHNPQIEGYYVVYEDGYASYSPADAFEGGYTRINKGSNTQHETT